MEAYFWFTIAGVAIGVWLTLGVLAYGMGFAYMQRHYTEDQVVGIWDDFLTTVRGIPMGYFAWSNIKHWLKLNEGWDFEHDRPRYGTKYLPRHEFRLRGS